MGTKVYFFGKNSYIRHDRGNDRVDENYPLPSSNWEGFTEAGFADSINTAINWGNGKLFFFKGDKYLRYDIVNDKVDDGYPLSIADKWPGFAKAGFADSISAAVNLGNGKVYFFKGDKYLRYDIAKDKVDDGYPRTIAGQWPGLSEAGFADNIGATINWGNGKVYFFKGDKYLRYDIAKDKADDGYPLSIAGNWAGFSEAGFATNISAAIDLFIDNADLWVASAKVVKSPVNGPKFLPLPWRGVLHTTEGPTLAGAVSSFKSTNFWPHFTIDPKTQEVVQHLPLTIGSRALSDKATPENAAHCIQIEIVGNAAQAGSWTQE
jgi:hypothetical protein